MFQNNLVRNIFHDSLLMQISLNVLNSLILPISVLNFVEDMPLLLSITDISPNLGLWKYDLHDFRRWSKVLKWVFLKQFTQIVFFDVE